MKNNRTLALHLLWFFCLLIVCKRSASAASLSEPKDLKSVMVTLERTACYGACPVYTVTIDGKGIVKYTGRQHVDIPGGQTAKVPPEKVLELLKSFDSIHFFSLQDSYGNYNIDLPVYIISVTVDGQGKTITNYPLGDQNSGPHVDLLKLADQIDAVSGANHWITCDYACLAHFIHSQMDVNGRGQLGDSALMIAVRKQDLPSIRLLLDSGAQVNAADDRGNTPLMYAVLGNNREIVSTLLAHGADVNLKAKDGATAM